MIINNISILAYHSSKLHMGTENKFLVKQKNIILGFCYLKIELLVTEPKQRCGIGMKFRKAIKKLQRWSPISRILTIKWMV